MIDELAYDQPPMIQFQCLKAVLEKIGKGFEFGAKYYDDITGEVYFDPETGEAKDAISAEATQNQYKYDYLFRLSLRITLDEKDDIRADVSFDIRLTRENEEINTHWYVNMILDYDMTSTTPIYTLTMWTANDERQLAFRGNYTYEYDYVDMKAAGINEWRKFVLEPDTKLVKDANHQSFETYRNEGVVFNADTCKWYADKDLKKITRYNETKGATIADAFFAFGLNSTNIDGTAFLSANGIQSDTITSAYRDFSEIFRKDVIYSLVSGKEDDHGENGGHGEAVGIALLTQDREAWGAQNIERDCTVSDLFTGFGPWGGAVIGVKRPCIYSVDANGNVIEMLQNFGDYDYEIAVGKSAWVKVNLSDRLSDLIANRLGGTAALEANGFLITIRLTNKTNPNETATFSAIVGFRSEIEEQEAKQFPAPLTAWSVPVYDTANGSYDIDDYKQGNNTIYLTVRNTTNDERTAYLSKLKAGGFVQDDINAYVKVIGQNVLFITVNQFEENTLRISVRQQANNVDRTYSSTFPAQAVASWVDGKFVIPTPTASGNLLYSYNADGKYIHIFGMTNEEIAAYVDTVANRENTRFVGDRMITTYYAGRFYTIEYNAYENTLYFELNLERYGAQEPQIYISVNGGDAQPFWWDGMYYTVTVTLAEGDTFVITPDAGKIEDPKAFTFSEGTYTVVVAGTYTISGLQGDLHIAKN